MKDYIDPALILGDINQHWTDFWIGESIYERTRNLLSHIIAFPYPEVQVPIVSSYLWTNQKFSSVLPILFCFGQPGSGKSNLAIVASKLHRSEPLNADNCTAVSLRNTCNAQKFLDEEKEYEADGALLILDNVQTATFKENRNLLSLFLGGYKRGQDKVQIGGMGGANIEFYTFSSRIISSVQPLHLEYELRELSSRCFLIPHSGLDLIPDEVLERQNFSVEEAVKPEDINWEGFEYEYLKVWGEISYCALFAQHKKSLRNTEKFPPRRWEMSRDVLATGLMVGAWSDPKKAKRCLSDYFELIDSMDTQRTPLEEILRDEFLARFVNSDGFENTLLVSFINLKNDQKAFLERPKAKEIEDSMLRLGWKRRKSKWEKIS